MAKKEYGVITSLHSALPRSKRRRNTPQTESNGGGGIVNVVSSGGSDCDAHTHSNKAVLDSLSMDDSGYAYLRHRTDEAEISITEKIKAGYADDAEHAGEADNASKWAQRDFDDYLDQPVRKTDSVQYKEVITDTLRGFGKFVDGLLGSGYCLWQDANGLVHMTLDKLIVRQTVEGGDSLVEGEQTVNGNHTVGGDSILKGDVIFGNHLESGDSIQGAKVTKEGHASFASVKSPYMEIFELLLNKQTAVGGEFKISDVGTIEEVTYPFGQEAPYTEVEFADYNREVHGRPWGAMLHLREEYEGYLTTFKYDDIVYGYVNGIGKSGSYSVYGQFFGVVKQVVDSRTLRVNIYADMQVPAGSNLLPVPHMVITQRGNETDTSRQSVITLSSPDKNMVILHGVDSPILASDGSCYGVSLGKLPESLYRYVVKAYPYLAREDMSLYVKNLIVQNLMRIDNLGKAIKDERYRGAWSRAVADGTVEGEDRYRVTPTTYDTVTHNGSKWQCQKDGSTVEPSDTTTEWSLIVAKGENGKSVSINFIRYGLSDSPSTKPSDSDADPNNNWKDSYEAVLVNGAIPEGKFLWTWTQYSDPAAPDGVMDAYGVSRQGNDGKSIKAVSTEYCITSTFSEPDKTADWPDTMDAALMAAGITDGKIPAGYYLWTRTVIDYTDDSVQDKVGVTVTKMGENGVGVSTLHTWYMNSDNGAAHPSLEDDDWHEDVPAAEEGRYLWTWIQFSDGTNAFSVSKSGESASIESIYYSDKFTAVQPADSSFTMVNPPAVPAGGYLWSKTTFKTAAGSKSVYSYAYQGMDNSAVVYTLKPNVNVIYVRDRKTVSADYICLTVGRTSSGGYEEITDSGELAEYGLKLQYAVDGETAHRVDLSISDTLIELEDGSGVLASEDGSALQLEFTVENILSIEKNITFYLVDEVSGKDEAVCVVPVMYDGEGNVMLRIDHPTVSHPVDGQSMMTIGTADYMFRMQIMKGTVVQPLDSDYRVIFDYEDYAGGLELLGTVIDTSTHTATAGFRIKEGVDSRKMPTHVKATLCVPGIAAALSAEGDICVVYSQRGIVGPMGTPGPFYYPCGAWNLATALLDPPVYVLKNGQGPYVLYPDDADTGIYYVRTENDIHYKTGSKTPLDPAEDYRRYPDAPAWRPMEMHEYIQTKVLLANFATIGRAVFWGDYQFSVEGYDTVAKAKSEYRRDMFDAHGRLGGGFVPNYFVDFKTGETKQGKLSEPFIQFELDGNRTPCKMLDLDEGYNVAIQPRIDDGGNAYPAIISMPVPTDVTAKDGDVLIEAGWSVDGAHSTMLYQAYDGFMNVKGSMTSDDLGSFLAILCADGRMFYQESYRMANTEMVKELVYAPRGYNGTDDDHEGYFVVNGCLTKFLLLAPGEMVRMRSCETKHGSSLKRFWYIENQSDFANVKMQMRVFPESFYDEDNGRMSDTRYSCTFDHTSDSGFYYDTHSAFASEYVRGVLSGNVLEYEVSLSKAGVSSLTLI